MSPPVDNQRKKDTLKARLWSKIYSFGHNVKLWFTKDPGMLSDQTQKALDASLELELAQKFRGGIAKSAQFMGYASGNALTQQPYQDFSTVFYRLKALDQFDIDGFFQDELGKNPSELFLEFDKVPVGAASLSQVHRAKSKDGSLLAVKIQYPGLEKTLVADLDGPIDSLLGGISELLLDDETVSSFKEGILSELDYLKEAQSLVLFGRWFQSYHRWIFPKPIEHLSTKHILTTSYVEGLPILEFMKQQPPDLLRNAIGQDLLLFSLLSPLLHGHFNADPNPGNFLLSSQKNDFRLGFVDFGLTIKLHPTILNADKLLFFALFKSDPEMLRLAFNREELVQDASVFQSSLYRRFEKLFSAPFLLTDFLYSASYSEEVSSVFWELVKTRQFILTAKNIFLWRQRIGMINLLGMLETRPNAPKILGDLFALLKVGETR